MCTAITLEEKTIDVVIDALAKKMSGISTFAIVTKNCGGKMQREYEACEKALDLFTKAKESLNTAKTMAIDK